MEATMLTKRHYALRRPLRSRTTVGMTLIEMLVTVAIIATLASLLFPAIGAARKLANGAACASNLRQISMATITYTSDNLGFLPHSWVTALPSHQPHPWGTARLNYASPAFLGQYLNIEEASDLWATAQNYAGKRSVNLVVCPGDSRPATASNRRHRISYGANIGIINQYWRGTNPYTVTHIRRVTNPSATMIFADGNNPRWRADTHLQYLTTDDRETSPSGPPLHPDLWWTSARHGGTNVAFLDGHVEKASDPRIPLNEGRWTGEAEWRINGR